MSTILDVAKLADVSIATVSRVINGDTAVRPRTRRLVEEAIVTLDYRPNAAARSLRLARSQTLGLVIPDLGNPVYIDLVHGIEDVARAHGYALFLCDAANDAAVGNLHLERLYERRIDGLIVYLALDQPPALSLFRDSGRPVVAMGPRAARSGFPAVIVGEIEATVLAIRRILALGHRRIAIVLRDVPAGRFRYRTEPVRRELEAAGVPWDAGLVLSAEDGERCRAVVGEALARPERPTALIVGTHSHTPWALQAVRRAGLRIPDDLSVLAYGDSAWAAAYGPPLTVVDIDYERWGREAASLLMRLMEQPASAGPPLMLSAEVIERGSLGPAPATMIVRESESRRHIISERIDVTASEHRIEQTVRPYTAEERARLRAFLDTARERREAWAAAGHEPLAESWPLIREERDRRSDELA